MANKGAEIRPEPLTKESSRSSEGIRLGLLASEWQHDEKTNRENVTGKLMSTL